MGSFAGCFSINNIVPSQEGGSSKIKIKMRMDVHGIFNVCGAQLVEKIPSEPESEPMETAPETQKKEEQADGEVPPPAVSRSVFNSFQCLILWAKHAGSLREV